MSIQKINNHVSSQIPCETTGVVLIAHAKTNAELMGRMRKVQSMFQHYIGEEGIDLAYQVARNKVSIPSQREIAKKYGRADVLVAFEQLRDGEENLKENKVIVQIYNDVFAAADEETIEENELNLEEVIRLLDL